MGRLTPQGWEGISAGSTPCSSSDEQASSLARRGEYSAPAHIVLQSPNMTAASLVVWAAVITWRQKVRRLAPSDESP